MKRISLLIYALTAALTSCININAHLDSAKGEVVERTITFTEDITSVAVSSGIDVTVDPTLPRGEVHILTHTDVQDLVAVTVENNSLDIKLSPMSLCAEVLEVRIPAYDFNSVATSGGSDFTWECCAAQTLNIAASSGSDIEIKGHCKVLNAAASSGADLDLEELITENVTVAASSGSDVHIHATMQLTANATSGADITYSGDPQHTHVNTSSGADINKAR